MTYSVKRRLGYEPWGVVNPWVFANLAQPQRRRVPSKYIWQTHPPREGMHPLGQVTLSLPDAGASEARARRMEIYSLIGISLSALIVWRALRGSSALRPNKGKRTARRNDDSDDMPWLKWPMWYVYRHPVTDKVIVSSTSPDGVMQISMIRAPSAEDARREIGKRDPRLRSNRRR